MGRLFSRDKNKGELMRALFKQLPILVIAGALAVACGSGENSSGGGSTTAPGINGLPGNTVTQTTSYQSVDQVRAAFNSKGLNDGLANGTEIYHMGPYFNNSYGNGGINFQGGFCINLFGQTYGDCQNNNGQQDYLLDLLDNGVYKKVTAASTTAVSYQEPSGVSNQSGFWQFTYDNSATQSYSRNSQDYLKMLALDVPMNNIVESRVSPATITMSNGQQVAGQILEVVTGYSNYGQVSVSDIRRYVLSTNLPIAANPIAVINGMSPIVNGYYGPTAIVNGYLAFLGNSNVQGQALAVQSIQIPVMHIYQGGYYNGGTGWPNNGQQQQSVLTPVQNITIGF